jgi:hypothetical protein
MEGLKKMSALKRIKVGIQWYFDVIEFFLKIET